MSEEIGYCSFCFEKTQHRLLEQNYIRRNEYICRNCHNKTFMCRFCNNFTKSGNKWDDELCLEHSGEIASFKMLNYKLTNLEDYKVLFKREHTNIGKVSTIAVGTIGGIAMITPLALIAAPAIGIGLSSIVGGALAIEGVGAIAMVSATGAALGGTIGGVISNNYFGDIDGFEIKKIKDGVGESILFIDGFLTQGEDDTREWEDQLKKLYPHNPWYYVSWESKRLRELASNIVTNGGIAALAKTATKAGLKKVVPIGSALTALGIVNNPWSIACTKAGQTGVLLADILARTDEKYILCGHSLGARVIYYTLKSLSTKKKKIIYQAHLMGGAIGADKNDWKKAKKAVIDKIFNYRSDKDFVLATMYKVGTFFTSKPIGRNRINVEGIIDIDVSSKVTGHTEYKKHFASFGRK